MLRQVNMMVKLGPCAAFGKIINFYPKNMEKPTKEFAVLSRPVYDYDTLARHSDVS